MVEGRRKAAFIAGASGAVSGAVAVITAYFYPAKTAVIALSAALSAACGVWFIVAHFGALKAYSRKRAAHLWLNNALMVVFFLFAVIMANIIARQYYFRWDLTSANIYTLSPQSKAVADAVKSPLTVTYFGVEGGGDYEAARQMLESYRYQNKNIVYEMRDLDRSPDMAKRLNVNKYGSVAVETASGFESEPRADEEAVTNLIIRATRTRVVRAGYLTGHGERGLESPERDGMSVISSKIKALGYELRPVALADVNTFAPDVDILIIASPKTGPGAGEAERMLKLWRAGVRFVILADDPGPGNGFLNPLGLVLGDYYVYDSQNVAGGDPSSPLLTSYRDHPITRDFHLSTIFPTARDVRPLRGHAGLEFKSFAVSSGYSWFEKNNNAKKDEGEKAGFNVFGGVVSRQGELGRAVVFGDGDFISNAYVGVEGNSNLFLNALAYLADEGGLIAVAPRDREFAAMYITAGQAKFLRLMAPGLVPAVIFAAGLIMWLRRRML